MFNVLPADLPVPFIPIRQLMPREFSKSFAELVLRIWPKQTSQVVFIPLLWCIGTAEGIGLLGLEGPTVRLTEQAAVDELV